MLWSPTLELLDRAACADAFVAAELKVKDAAIVAGGRTVGPDGIDSAYGDALCDGRRCRQPRRLSARGLNAV